MDYNLGRYKYRSGKVYRKKLLFYFCIDKGPYPYKEGVRQVNKLALGDLKTKRR